LRSNFDATTFNPASLPSGWATVLGGGGTCTVAGGEILMTAPPSGNAYLDYTFPSLEAADTIVLMIRCYRKTAAGTTPGTLIQIQDDRKNTYTTYHLLYQSNVWGCFSQTDGTYFGVHAGASTAQTLKLKCPPGNDTTAVTSVSYMSAPFKCPASTIHGGDWTASVAKNGFTMGASSGAGGATNTVMAIDYAAIYTGVE
jgi:hypothetical protein